MKLRYLCAFLLVAAMPAAPITISPQPYGINVHVAQDNVLAKVKAAGITWIRIDVDWSVIEASRGKTNYDDVDRVIDYAATHGLSVYASIGTTPGWANNKKGGNYPATKVTDWTNFVTRTIGRYKNRIKYWGIWNEPNLKIFFALGKDKFVEQVLLPAVKTIRSTDPAAFIVGPELSHKTETGSEWYFWMKYILDNAGGYFDIISHHIYEDHGVYYMYELLEEGDKLIPSVKKIVAESGQDGKPFWITETGWHTRKYSDTMQANRYLDMLHTRARKNFPQKVFFYEIIDDPRSSVDPFGILRNNLEAKPAYHTYRDYISGLLPDPGDPDENETNKKCYAEVTTGHAGPAAADPALQSMRRVRDCLRGYSFGAGAAVDLYYEWNEEFLALALSDSRVFHLGREIMEQALALLGENDWLAMELPLPDTLYRNAKALTRLIRREYPQSPLAPMAVLLDSTLEATGKVPLRDLLEHHLGEDMAKFKKSR
ncbi:MAG: cellulase family glycosylhydrolase [Candidatus Aminicenantes bacterium]|nr:cellulase family glycosylhydrolase [Candidatus Aminicenantes bacterium]